MKARRLAVISAFGVFSLLTLVSCGGGGDGTTAGSGTGSANAGGTTPVGGTAASISVRPSLGCFRNVEVLVFDVEKGESVGSGKIPSTGCDASISLSGYSGGPVVLKAKLLIQPAGFNAATYCNDTENAACFFNEGTGVWEPYIFTPSGPEALLAPLPEIDSAKTYGINKVTNALAAALSIPSNFDEDPSQVAQIRTAVTKNVVSSKVAEFVAAFSTLGISDILAAPTRVAASSQDIADFQSSTVDPFSALFFRDALESNPLSSALSFQRNVANSQALTTVFSSSITNARNFVALSAAERTTLVSRQSQLRITEKQQASSSSAPTARQGSSFSETGNDVEGSTEASVLRVVPMLGRFSAGATVEVLNPVDGSILVAAQVGTDGFADLTLPANLNRSFLVKVSNPRASASVTYFDVGLSQNQGLGTKPMYALVPTLVRPTTGAVIGVTPVTDMAAALAGVGPSSETISAQGATDDARAESIANKMFTAYAQSQYMLGWVSPQLTSSLNARYQLNPLLPPVRINANTRTAGIDAGQAGGFWAIFFAELAIASRDQGFPDFINFVQEVALGVGEVGLRRIAEEVAADLNANRSNSSYGSSVVSAVIRSTNSVLANSRSPSGFLQTCISIDTTALAPITAVFQRASLENPKADFDSVTISRLVNTLKEDMRTLLTGNPKRFNLPRDDSNCS